MGNTTQRRPLHTAAIIILVLVWIGAAGLIIALYEHTLISVWLPLLICCFIGAVSGLAMWRLWPSITGSQRILPNYLCHFIFSATLAGGLLFSLNYFASDADSEQEITATVVRKYTKERRRTQRSGRRHYSTGETYHVYYADLSLPDGRTKSMQITLSRYNRLRTGSHTTLHLQRGLLGIPVIR